MDAEPEEQKSRSQIKREFAELKELVRELVGLTPRELESIPLSEDTHAAVLAAHDMVRTALKRQIRHIVNRLEYEDVPAIRSALAGEPQTEPPDDAEPDEARRIVDELVAGDDQRLIEFVEDHPQFDWQQLRQLVRKARKERDQNKPPRSADQLFELLKGSIADEG